MSAAITAKQAPQVALAAELLRLVLYKGELCRLPANCYQVRVVSGQAWLTIPGEDIVLDAGQSLSLSAGHHCGLVSAVGKCPLIMEISGVLV